MFLLKLSILMHSWYIQHATVVYTRLYWPLHYAYTVRSEVIQLQREITEHLNDGRRGEKLRSGIHVTIVGAPNAGKSSLLNILCKQKCTEENLILFNGLCIHAGQRPAAIVSPYAGTTRDLLESTLDIFGYPIILRYCMKLSSYWEFNYVLGVFISCMQWHCRSKRSTRSGGKGRGSESLETVRSTFILI